MTIRRGEQWGSEVVDRPEVRIAADDAELAAWIAHEPGGAYGVSGGDLHRTIGHPSNERGTLWRLPIDVLHVRTESSVHLAVAHVAIRRWWWRGPLIFVCNVDHVGRWNVAPRAHPNDGRFDVVTVDASMSIRDRAEFRRRLPTRRHVPPPSVVVETATTWSWQAPSGARVRVDGRDIGVHTSLEVSLESDFAALLV
ncbi:MAG: hypothetical protein ACO3WU_12090 [Ilumatobacteraceae bacterium]